MTFVTLQLQRDAECNVTLSGTVLALFFQCAMDSSARLAKIYIDHPIIILPDLLHRLIKSFDVKLYCCAALCSRALLVGVQRPAADVTLT